ncbi:L-threonine ammonia-lyase-like [Haliotis asinina]|uniref:L-threonine ammonia-lyase-like n=1 Tax=Haliotis asinina TaxID=109174 RepID=UPI003531D11A
MADSRGDLVTEADMQEARQVVTSHPLCVRTPLLQLVHDMFPQLAGHNLKLYLKLENMQTTGSFKIRGVVNQMKHLQAQLASDKIPITMSAGNYGKAFATYLHQQGVPGKCMIPNTAPQSRVHLIQSLGVSVEQMPTAELQTAVDNYTKDGSHVYCHPFDDIHLIAGYASVAMEILEEVPDPDIVLVCCGGGGLVSGVSAAIKTLGPSACRVYAVEPEGVPCMSESFKLGKAVSRPVNTVATGLGPPFAGQLTYRHCSEFVERVLLVSDVEIVQCTELLYKRGLVVEPSGAAAMAALLNGKVPDIDGKKVIVVITGGNVTPGELISLINRS